MSTKNAIIGKILDHLIGKAEDAESDEIWSKGKRSSKDSLKDQEVDGDDVGEDTEYKGKDQSDDDETLNSFKKFIKSMRE